MSPTEGEASKVGSSVRVRRAPFSPSPPRILSIAGSDPSGGAGIQADLKTFSALGCYGLCTLTALTAQNTRGVQDIHIPPAQFCQAQLQSLWADVQIDAVKIGMLGNQETVQTVASELMRDELRDGTSARRREGGLELGLWC